MKLTHKAKPHESLARAALRITVAQVPACCFIGRTLPYLLVGISVSWSALACAGKGLFAAGEIIFLVSDHPMNCMVAEWTWEEGKVNHINFEVMI
jgi:hypothetical protein